MPDLTSHPLLPILLPLLLLTSGCSSTGQQPLPPPVASPPDAVAQAVPANSQDMGGGELVIHVGKSGRLARLGHNHLVASDQLAGEIWLARSGSLTARVQVQVASLSVDDPKRRASYRALAEVPEWADIYRSTPSAKNIADTRANMLGDKVLDATRYPTIEVTATAPDAAAEFGAGNGGSLNVDLDIQIKQHRVRQPAILHWVREASGAIAWECRFSVTHTGLGMTPFTALGGALSVADELAIEVRGELPRSVSVQTLLTSVGRDEIEELDPVRARQPPQRRLDTTNWRQRYAP